MKAPKTFSDKLRQYQFAFYVAMFAAWTWSAWHDKRLREMALYSVALAASIFLGILQLRDVRKAIRDAGREERQEEKTP